ncbi:DinB family protein [Mesobacillus foraminis]|uniref:DinB family protein n=1 Tax=Mesobacillus foraminis TaxID=279826 RepID=UPI001BE9A19E|nr:DinB family protein [Mesobacillus foraminis]MBT2756946.1 DinB family protein [Mesobacillus foraminis]
MELKLSEAIELLERTPCTLESFLLGASDGWLYVNEGEGTWNVHEIVGHLIEGEKTNWIPRLEMILQEGKNAVFPPFDRFSHLKGKQEFSMEEKLHLFKSLREQNTARLRELVEPDLHFQLKGLHPEFGEVKLRELLSAWVVHDLTHISQIVRVMAERYREDVGPWEKYLGVLKKRH